MYRQQKLGAFKSVRKKNLYLDSTPKKEYSSRVTLLSRSCAHAGFCIHASLRKSPARPRLPGYLLPLTDTIRTNIRLANRKTKIASNGKIYSSETVKFATVIVNVLFSTVHKTQSSLTSTSRGIKPEFKLNNDNDEARN